MGIESVGRKLDVHDRPAEVSVVQTGSCQGRLTGAGCPTGIRGIPYPSALPTGALMVVFDLSADAAFDLLCWYSQTYNVRVSDIADELAASAAAP